MHKVNKFLLLISRKERERLIPIMQDITEGKLLHLDCKKLKGENNKFRVGIRQSFGVMSMSVESSTV